MHRGSGVGRWGLMLVAAVCLTVSATACVADLAGVEDAAKEYMDAVVADDPERVHAATCAAAGLTPEEVEAGIEHGRTSIGVIEAYRIDSMKATRSTSGPPSAIVTGTVELDDGAASMGMQLLKEADGWRVCDLRIDEV